jgi:hypothetical protein
MANRYFEQFLHSFTKKLVSIHGVVSIAADASVSGHTIKGATVTKTGVGEYTIELDDAYVDLVSAQATFQAATAVDLVPQIKSADVTTAKTVVIRLLTGVTPTDPSAVCKLHVHLLLRNSKVS